MTKKTKNLLLIILSAVVLSLVAFIGGFYIYSLDYYRADDKAISLLTAENVKQEDDIITISSDKTDIGIIFYPGGKVEYTAYNLDKIKGLILLGAYIYGDVPKEKALVVYGTNDIGLDKTKLLGGENQIEIKGGNHALFGNYGEQKGDGKAEISRESQQEQTVDLIDNFILDN